jgi:hypothetical protein
MSIMASFVKYLYFKTLECNFNLIIQLITIQFCHVAMNDNKGRKVDA